MTRLPLLLQDLAAEMARLTADAVGDIVVTVRAPAYRAIHSELVNYFGGALVADTPPGGPEQIAVGGVIIRPAP